MDSKDTLNAFQLEDHNILDNQVEAITTVKGHTFVNDRNRNLSLKPQSTQMQLVAETFLID